MSAYFGELNALTAVHCAADLRGSSSRPVSYSRTLGGATFAQVGPRTNRVWDVRLPRISTPAELATWQTFVEGEHGPGPWSFFSEMAIITNMLSPRASMLDTTRYATGTTPGGGRMHLPDGSVAGRSMIVAANTTLLFPYIDGDHEHLPVRPGVPATGSVWISGTSVVQLRMDFYDADRQHVRRVYGDVASGAGVQRLTVVATPSEGEQLALLGMGWSEQSFRIARPAFSWTPDVPDWSVGQGARKVLITGTDTDTTLAIAGRAMAGTSFTLTEVG